MSSPLLLHACCGPCAIMPVEGYMAQGFEPVLFWSNSNIQGKAEYLRRRDTFLSWADSQRIDVIEGPYEPERWEAEVAPHLFNRAERCRACYAMRLEALCDAASREGFPAVATTLAVSPYQRFELCGELLAESAESRNLTAHHVDFREQYPEATRRARELGLYRQRHCGCRFSAAESAIERHTRRDRNKRR